MALDADTRQVVATVPDTPGSHGAAIAPDLGLGFSDNGAGGQVTIFDLQSLQPRGKLKAGTDTDGVFYDAFTKTGFVNNGSAGTVTLFDPVAMTVRATIDLATKKPEFADVDGTGRAFIDLQDRNSVAVIDLAKMERTAVWAVRDCEQPSSLFYDRRSRRLFLGCRGAKPVLAVVNADTGATVATVPIGAGNDWVGFDAKNHLVLLTNGAAATLSIVRQTSADDYGLEMTVGTRPLARTGAFDPTTHRLFIVAAQYEQPAPSPGAPAKNRVLPGTVEMLTYEPSTEQR